MIFAVDKSLGKTILKLAYPITIAMLTQTAINLVDTIMVGRLSSEWSIAGQSAIAISLILLWACGGLIASISVGTQALAARRFGEGKREEAGQILNNALVFSLVVMVLLSGLVIYSLPYIFPFLHSDPNVVRLGVEYCTYRIFGATSMVLTIVFKGFFDGIGRTKIHMNAAIVMNVANIILNYCMIFGVGPFPQMYVAGAGVASLVATFVGLYMMIHYAVEPGVRKEYGLFRLRSIDMGISKSVVKLGIPGGLATLFVMAGFAAFITIVGWIDAGNVEAAAMKLSAYGQISVASFAAVPSEVWTQSFHHSLFADNPPVNTAATKVIMDILSVVFMSCMAFGQATATLVGQSMGAKQFDLAERYGWESTKLGAYIMGAIGLLIFAFPDQTAALFNPNPLVVEACHDSLMLMGLSPAFIAAGMILSQALFGAGHTVFVMVVEMVLHLCCLVPVAYVLGVTLNGGLLGIWSSALLYVVLLSIVMIWKFNSGDWKQTRI